jgi:hypothetical protein
MKNYPSLLRHLLVFQVLLLALTACGRNAPEENTAIVVPQATATPVPFTDLFATPTADLFDFLNTPTNTTAPIVQVATPTSNVVVLPQTGADLTVRTRLLDRLKSAGLVAAGLLLVAFGLWRVRR